MDAESPGAFKALRSFFTLDVLSALSGVKISGALAKS